MKVVLTNLSDELYAGSRNRLNDSAARFGITEINSFDVKEIKNTDFYHSNKKILDHPKGAGAWLWKPYIILQTIKKLNAGDVVIYADSGLEIIDSLQPLINICASQQEIMLFANGNFINANWTKRDTFILMDSDNKHYWYSLQCDASFSLFRKTERSIQFITEWLEYCQDERILIDSPNVMGKKNLPGYTEHRWDQSVLSLLAKRYELPLFRMPSQFGNHYKSPALRVKGEFNVINQMQQRHLNYYARHPYDNSPYFQLLNHHRRKNIVPGQKTIKRTLHKTIYAVIIKRIKKVAGILSMWYNKKFLH